MLSHRSRPAVRHLLVEPVGGLQAMQTWIGACPEAALSRLCRRGRWDNLPVRGREAIAGFLLTGDARAMDLWPPGPVEFEQQFDARPPVVMRADPVNLIPSADRLILNQVYFHELTDEDAIALVETIHQSLADTGASFCRGESGHWYLVTDAAPDGRWWSPAEVEGQHVLEFMPGGASGGRLNALTTEIQMLLHEHPVNLRRVEQGLPAINSVWPWGWCSRPAVGGSPVLQARLLSGDIYAIALDRLGSGPAAADADELAVVSGKQGEDPAQYFSRLEREWAAPLLRDLWRGRISGAQIDVTDGVGVMTSRLDLLKFWRRSAR